MRLLLIAHSHFPWTADYARYFMSRGDEVRLVSFSPHRLDGVAMDCVGAEPFDMHRNKHLFVTRVPAVRRIVRAYRPDVVMASYVISNGLTAVLSWDGPTLVSAVGGDVQMGSRRGGLRRWWRRRVVSWVCGRATHVHAVSAGLIDELRSLGVPAEKLSCWPIGVDLSRYRPADAEQLSDQKTDSVCRLIVTRRHEPVYDQGTILQALALLRAEGVGFHSTFVGGGSLLAGHERQAAAAGLSDCTQFVGQVEHDRVPELLRAADVYVSASMSDGTSSSLLEAMASGLFPVVSRIPANQPWIDDGRTGLLFTTGDAQGLAAALRRAVSDAALRQAGREANRKRVAEEADLHRNMQRTAELLKTLVEQHRGPGPI